MPHNLSRERNLPEPLKIRTDWFNPSIAHQYLCSSVLYLDSLRNRRGRYVDNSPAWWRTLSACERPNAPR